MQPPPADLSWEGREVLGTPRLASGSSKPRDSDTPNRGCDKDTMVTPWYPRARDRDTLASQSSGQGHPGTPELRTVPFLQVRGDV